MRFTETIPRPSCNSTSLYGEGAPYSIPATEYATAWVSLWTDPEFGVLDEHDLELLKHVNCSYLSSGKPPTLLALKQHAQSLAILISKLCVSNTFGVVDGKGERRPAFEKNEAFDWLIDLGKPYNTDDENHHIPLPVLMNNNKKEDEETGIECHCPLEVARHWAPLEPGEITPRPYCSHHGLVMHANALLEVLDNEYGATGGIHSLLPSGNEDDCEQMSAARNTLLGQFLLHHQHLVKRVHDLEIDYANALDALADEAVAPMQRLSNLGAEERSKGREIVYHQDRFILANAGNDIFDLVHRLMDKEEAKLQSHAETEWNSGVSSEHMWSKTPDGEWCSRGLTAVDLVTRFVRLKGHGDKSTVFVLPAIEHDPKVAQTRKIESQPTVVSVVAPYWPQRASVLEKREKAHLERAEKLQVENQALARDKEATKANLSLIRTELNRKVHAVKCYEGGPDGKVIGMILRENAALKRRLRALKRYQVGSAREVSPRLAKSRRLTAD